MDPIKDYILSIYHSLLLNKGTLYKLDYKGLYYQFLCPFNIFSNYIDDFELYIPPFDENEPRFENTRIPRNLLLGFDKNGFGMYRWHKINDIINLIKKYERYILSWIRRKDYVGILNGLSNLIFKWLLYNYCKELFYYTSSIRVDAGFIRKTKQNFPEIKFLPFLLNLSPALYNMWRFFSLTIFDILFWLNNNAELKQYVQEKHTLQFQNIFKKFLFLDNPTIYPVFFTNKFVILAKMGTNKEYKLLVKDHKKLEWMNEIEDEFSRWKKKDETQIEFNRLYNYKASSPIILLVRF